MNDWSEYAPLVLASVMFVPAVTIDVTSRRIPNMVCLAGLLAGLLLHGMLGGLAATGEALVGAGALLLIMFPFFCIGWMGAGDVKLLAAVGAICGSLITALTALLATVIAGVPLALAGLLMRTRLASGPVSQQTFSIPYSIAIAAGTVYVLARQAFGG